MKTDLLMIRDRWEKKTQKKPRGKRRERSGSMAQSDPDCNAERGGGVGGVCVCEGGVQRPEWRLQPGPH